MSSPWFDEVLSFWFGELDRNSWFAKDPALDQRIRNDFLATYRHVRDVISTAELSAEPRVALAGIITLDQLPRNMFRDTLRMFESDGKALELAHLAVKHALHERMEVSQRLFCFLPFEHSETLADQHLSVELFRRLGDADYLRYAEAHRDIVARFGRFPHRNAILGRPSTSDEIAFLQQPGSSF